MDEDKYAWRQNYTTMQVAMNNEKDAEIIAEAKRRKEKYNTTIGYTLRRWIRLGYAADKQSEEEDN